MIDRQPKESPLSKGKEKKQFIGEQLLNAGLITQKQLDEVLEVQQQSGGKMIEILMRKGYIDAQTFVKFLSKHQGIAGIDLLNYMIPKEVISLIPEELAREHELIPIDRMGKFLTIAMACPMDTKTLHEMEELTGLRIKPLLVSMSDLHAALNRYYGSSGTQQIQDFNTMPYASNPSGGMEQRALQHREEAVEDLSSEAASTTPADATSKAPRIERVHDHTPLVGACRTDSAGSETQHCKIDIQPLVEKIINLESLPIRTETTQALERLLADAESSSGDVASCVQQDPGMAAMLLKAANTSENSFSHTIGNIELAIALLGNQEVMRIAQAAQAQKHNTVVVGLDLDQYWSHATFCAYTARQLALDCALKDIGTAYAAGLLHDIGRLLLAQIGGECYQYISPYASEETTLKEELAVFGITHPEVGLILADAWGMPNTLTVPIRFHSAPDEAHEAKHIVKVVALAARLADVYTLSQAPSTRVLLDALKLPESRCFALFAETAEFINIPDTKEGS